MKVSDDVMWLMHTSNPQLVAVQVPACSIKCSRTLSPDKQEWEAQQTDLVSRGQAADAGDGSAGSCQHGPQLIAVQVPGDGVTISAA